MYPSISALKNPKLIPDPPKKLLIISPKDLYGITASKGGEEYAKKLGFDVRTEEVEKGAKDYTPIISWAKGSGVDGVITVLWPGDFFLFFRQIQEMKFRPKYLDGLHGSAATKVWETFGETAQGLCAGGYYGARFPTYENKEYNERYKKKCGEDPTHFSSMEVATGQIMHQAIEKAGTLDRKKVKEILKRDEFKCVYSNRVKFVSEGGCTNINKFSYFTLLQWQNGKALTLYPPEFAEAKPIYPMPFK